ncbi:formate dehydrogenase accessory protein FdhE [Pseudodesulfovibrio sediminis]|uniref:Formate dehydrogenase accessory protein FdhE n=1 Tax=Pseudodesulfovibrio sediminis TaxID=2810563 RepID=A0ABN6ETT8_9BACT|nr:formate dehydrogenase accessory protein FdhE [Pseudodesulfovibrio sediminis]BCS89742.1 formate dehydrogenase accessory protein FdhE [Pseudodesulfovibrio sediminis]
MEFNLDDSRRRLKGKITQLKKKSYISTELIDLLEAVAAQQLEARAESEVTLPGIEHFASPEAVLQGVPLLGREDFPIDKPQAEKLLGTFITLLVDMGGPLGDGARAVREALDSNDLTSDELFQKFLEDDHKFFAPWAERMPEAPRTLSFLAFASLSPSLEAVGAQLAPNLPEVKVNPVGTCPICGSLPLISTLREKEGFRHCTCSFCRHEYRVKRIACPVCGEEDQKKLTFFTVEEEPGFRVDVCDTCKTYIKTIDFRDLDRIAVPILDDLDSLALDYVAAGQGYKRATLSAWGF